MTGSLEISTAATRQAEMTHSLASWQKRGYARFGDLRPAEIAEDPPCCVTR